jgi:hypothetical protein
MPVISAILITVVVPVVWLAGLSAVLRGYFRAIPVSAAVAAVCVLLLTGGSAIAALAAAMGVLIGVPVGLWVLVTIRINVRPRGVRGSTSTSKRWSRGRQTAAGE